MPASARFRIGEFVLDANTGEIRSADGVVAARLQPQPTRLLALLAERDGALVTRDEIRAALWPDVEVDVEAGLHFCVRQIRSALGDRADEPRYVETLPRRGYRLAASVERLSDDDAARGESRTLAAVGSLLLAGICAVWLALGLTGAGGSTVPRVGILPSLPPADRPAFAGAAPLADRVLEGFSPAIDAGRIDVVGPTTTSGWDRAGSTPEVLAAAHGLDYVVHVRFVPDDDAPALLAELIRASDGAHVRVRRVDDWSDPARVGREIAADFSELVAPP